MSRRVQIGKQRGIIGNLVSLVMQALLSIFCVASAAMSSWALAGGKPKLFGEPLFSARLLHDHIFVFGVMAEWALAIALAWSLFRWLRAPASVEVEDDGSWSLRNALGALLARLPEGASRRVDMKTRGSWGMGGMNWYLAIGANEKTYVSMSHDSESIGAAYKALLPDPTN